ncbi:MAG: hypothetical protein L6Q71_07265, partial [Planctomycetes bacterium]|nr:hypothetical protein [Planctomycetota bacterium]
LSALKLEPIPFDPDDAQTFLDAYRPRLHAISSDRLEIARLDMDAVGRALLSVSALIEVPTLRLFYEGAAKNNEFFLENLAHLKALSFIVQLAQRKIDAAGAFMTTAKIPADMDKASAELEARMQKTAEHYFSEDAEIGPMLRQLSPGTGFLDRANDLLGYAQIYELGKDIVSRDPLYYRATDVADAKRLAGQILAALGAEMTPAAREWTDILRRAWTMLRPVYREVQELGLRFLRLDPRREERFPSLFVMGRSGQGRKRAKKEEGSDEVGSGDSGGVQ